MVGVTMSDATSLAEFKLTVVSGSAPPQTLEPPLQALWWAAKGDWHEAHRIVMGEESREAAWVHAFLHRVEGDGDNARYWYGQARRSAATGPHEAEWDEIATALIGSS
jgi:hypothetical protein